MHEERNVGYFIYIKRLGHGRQEILGFGNLGKVYEGRAIGKRSCQLGGDMSHETRFANPRRSKNCDETNIIAGEQAHKRVHFFSSPEEGSQDGWEIAGRKVKDG